MISLDLETTSLDPRQGKIICISAYDGKCDQLGTLDQYTQEWFNNTEFIFHNAAFDLEFLALNGFKVNEPIHDTKLMAYLLCKPSTSLKDLAETELGEKVIRFEDVCGKGKKSITFDKALEQNRELAEKYAKQDAVLTYKLFQRLQLQMEPRIWDLYTKLELPLLRVLLDMRLTGIQVDLRYLRSLETETRQEIYNILKEMMPYIRHKGKKDIKYEWIDLPCNDIDCDEEECDECSVESREIGYYQHNININSPKQVGELLYKQFGLPITKRTATKAPATDTEALRNLTGMHPFVDSLMSYRDANKRLSTYIEPLIREGEKGNGTVYPKMQQMVTATGRLSSSSPINFQNIPKRKGAGLAIRQAFKTRDGHVFIEADYVQQEARIMSHFSNDPNLCKLLNSNVDLYVSIVQQIYKCSQEEAEKKRDLGKLLFLALSYGAQAKKLSRSAQTFYNLIISEEEMQELLDKCQDIFRAYFLWRLDILMRIREKEYSETILGRRRYFPKINSADKWERWAQEREAVNSVIQGSGADITKMAIVKLHKAGYKILLTVHDSVLIEVDDGLMMTDAYAFDIKEIMENIVKLRVPLKVDIKVSERWGGDLQEVEDASL